MSNATKTFDLYREMGVFAGLKNVGIKHAESGWEVNGHFQDANGRRNARLAQFDDVTDAVAFEAMIQASIL